MKTLALTALLFGATAYADIDIKIAETCRIMTCSTMSVQEVNVEQAKCQSYFKLCMAQGKMKFDDNYNYSVCAAARPAQILADKVEATVGEIKARRRIENYKTNERRDSVSGSAE